MVCYYMHVLASATSVLISSHRSLIFWAWTAQKTNGEYIVRAFGFTPRASPLLGVCDPEGSNFLSPTRKKEITLRAFQAR